MYGYVVRRIFSVHTNMLLESFAKDVIKMTNDQSNINKILKMPLFWSSKKIENVINDFLKIVSKKKSKKENEMFKNCFGSEFDKNSLLQGYWSDGYDNMLLDTAPTHFDTDSAIDFAKFLNYVSTTTCERFNNIFSSDEDKKKKKINFILKENYKFLPELWRSMQLYNQKNWLNDV